MGVGDRIQGGTVMIERYRVVPHPLLMQGHLSFETCDTGEWVHAADYLAMEQERDTLRQRVEELEDDLKMFSKELMAEEARATAAFKLLSALDSHPLADYPHSLDRRVKEWLAMRQENEGATSVAPPGAGVSESGEVRSTESSPDAPDLSHAEADR